MQHLFTSAIWKEKINKNARTFYAKVIATANLKLTLRPDSIMMEHGPLKGSCQIQKHIHSFKLLRI